MSRLHFSLFLKLPLMRAYFSVFNMAENYISYQSKSRRDYCEVHVIRTSEKCFRVITYFCIGAHLPAAEYFSCRTMRELEEYLLTVLNRVRRVSGE